MEQEQESIPPALAQAMFSWNLDELSIVMPKLKLLPWECRHLIALRCLWLETPELDLLRLDLGAFDMPLASVKQVYLYSVCPSHLACTRTLQ